MYPVTFHNDQLKNLVNYKIYRLLRTSLIFFYGHFFTNAIYTNLIHVIPSIQTNPVNYYSFVKSHADHKWYKFNDTHVEQVALDNDDTLLADECFGGTFTSPASSTYSSMEERVRYWNGYLLFYRATNADATVNLLFNSDDEDDHADADADADDGEKPTEAPLNQGKLNSRNTKRGGSYFKSYFKKALIRFHTKIDFFPHKLILPD